MNRLISTTLLLSLSLSALLLFYLWADRSSLLARRIEKALHVPVDLEDLELSWDRVVLRNLVIHNLPDSQLQPAFSAETLTLTFQIKDLWNQPTTLQSIVIENPQVSVEMYNKTGSDNNWKRMLGKSSLDTEGEKPAAASSPSAVPGKSTYILKHVRIDNTQVVALNHALSSRPFRPRPIRSIELKELSDGRPLPIDQIVRVIALALLDQIDSLPGLTQILVEELPSQIIDEVIPDIPGREEIKNKLEKELKRALKKW